MLYATRVHHTILYYTMEWILGESYQANPGKSQTMMCFPVHRCPGLPAAAANHFPSNFRLMFHSLKWCPTAPKATQRGPKGMPFGHHVRYFGHTGESVKTMVSCRRNNYFESRRGSPETSCAALCAACFSTCLSEPLSLILWRFAIQRGSRGKAHE